LPVDPDTSLNSGPRITVELYDIEPMLHQVLCMPTVVRSKRLAVVLPEVIYFLLYQLALILWILGHRISRKSTT
jgi:hypothetical protein